MTTQSSPVITDMKVIPVAGHDSMLLNIGGAHNAYFTRNIVVLTDNAGHTGVGEAPGGEVIYQTLVDAIPMVLGQEVARLNKVVQQVHKGNQAADFDTFGKGAWTFELRVNAVAALEAALLDLLGQALNVPVCELLGPGKQRDAVTVLGYLFYIGDRTKTDLPYLESTPGSHEWYRLRHTAPLSAADKEKLERFSHSEGLSLFLAPFSEILETVSGEAPWYDSHGLRLAFSPRDFIQVNEAVNQQMVARALEWLDVRAEDRVLDLFCGMGNFTLPLATRAASVIGVEGVPALVEKGRENAIRNGLHNVTFFHENLEEDVTKQPWAKNGFDKVLLDPARAGATGVMRHIIKLKPIRIVYVSCNPATLARDSEALVNAGYEVTRLAMLDMFPHTGHLESMVLFERM
ncbi:23S rRNA (uracil(1939)-C(5))-methyltransferase RlmD [Salmonella enterica]|nr:23S rRNA (uracil(1939)-C(5))-methyltransferase RlmD [Salmonella enterica]